MEVKFDRIAQEMTQSSYYDIFSKKTCSLNTYSELIRFFISQRIFPIMCHELNHMEFQDYRDLPVPELNGRDEVVLLANDDAILTPDYYLHYDISHASWPYLVLCKATQKTDIQSVYKVIARTHFIVSEDGSYSLAFQKSLDKKYSNSIELFQSECNRLASQILCSFKNTPLLLGIHQYNDSIKSFQKNFLKDINNELKKQGFPNYEAYFESGNYEIDVRIGLSKRRDYAYDDLFDLINYDNGYDDRMPNNVKKLNQFSINIIVTRNQWIDPVSYGRHKSSKDEQTVSELFVKQMQKEYSTLKIATIKSLPNCIDD